MKWFLILFLLSCSFEKNLPARLCTMTLVSIENRKEWKDNQWEEKQVQSWITRDGLQVSLIYPYDTPYQDTVGSVRSILVRF
jgi:hypothetical protein